MGIFSKKSSRADEVSKEYLLRAPKGARTEVLAGSCEQQIAALPVAARALVGQPVGALDHLTAVEFVRETLRQDRDLSAFVARKSIQHLHVAMSHMTETGGERIEKVFNVMGLASDGSVKDPHLVDTDLADHARTFGQIFRLAFRAVMLGRQAGDDYAFYEDLYTGDSGDDVEALAYDVIAWQAIALGRLVNAEIAGMSLLTLQPEYRVVPSMAEAAWYPNPINTGGIVDGDARAQRFWDGDRWTDDARMRTDGGWRTMQYSLHQKPNDDPLLG